MMRLKHDKLTSIILERETLMDRSFSYEEAGEAYDIVGL